MKGQCSGGPPVTQSGEGSGGEKEKLIQKGEQEEKKERYEREIVLNLANNNCVY